MGMGMMAMGPGTGPDQMGGMGSGEMGRGTIGQGQMRRPPTGK
jgi:hypothetical protein